MQLKKIIIGSAISIGVIIVIVIYGMGFFLEPVIFSENLNFLFTFGKEDSGDGEFTYTTRILVDDSAKIYVTDTENNRIQVFDPSGEFLFKFGKEGSGDGEFDNPYDIALDKFGRLYVVDIYNNRIQVFDPSGNFLFKFGYYCDLNERVDSDDSGSLELCDGGFIYTHGIAVDNSNRIYVLDYGNNRVQVYEWQESIDIEDVK